jgi:hypothetical protein
MKTKFEHTVRGVTVEVEINPDPKPEYESLPGPCGSKIIGPTYLAYIRSYCHGFESLDAVVKTSDGAVSVWGSGFEGTIGPMDYASERLARKLALAEAERGNTAFGLELKKLQ